ncbi:hypothetical protein M2137_000182 [Parabacteroides sp. PFB2-10]|uniref:hypothetical protein n=1 Tax=Parabacteroides sp. PFB2-10 TaxID=1742405 RepID=UPI002474C71D|nr:hypothetical protein [Parabacteroides sp. PFB2-10]MDH6311432.1 hypothetical protein [Parabacteroides sp. PFB2-10]MDL2244301.1 hypothetical protein [Parabacteroides sp. OttesenSCG-928-J18]
MIVITSAELRNNMEKYLDMAKTQKVIIQRGKTETFVLSGGVVEPDLVLKEAMTAEEMLVGIEEDVRELFRKNHKG